MSKEGRENYRGKGAELFFDHFALMPAGPDLDVMNARASRFIERFLVGEDLEQILDLLGLSE